MFNCYSLCSHRHSETRPHLRSAVCRYTQFRMAINTVVSQRGCRTASCVVDVEWLKVWVQLVVQARGEDYRDLHLNRLFIVWSQMNNRTLLHWMPSMRQGRLWLDRRPAWNDVFFFQKLERRRRVFLQQCVYRITVQNLLLSNKDKYSFCHPQYCLYVRCNCQCNLKCLWTLLPCSLKIIVWRIQNYNVTVPVLQRISQ